MRVTVKVVFFTLALLYTCKPQILIYVVWQVHILSITSKHTNHSLRASVDEGVKVKWLKIILNYSGAVIG